MSDKELKTLRCTICEKDKDSSNFKHKYREVPIPVPEPQIDKIYIRYPEEEQMIRRHGVRKKWEYRLRKWNGKWVCKECLETPKGKEIREKYEFEVNWWIPIGIIIFVIVFGMIFGFSW